MNNKLLAIGIPTYKRPSLAIKAIKNLIDLDVYDQIIVSSNSNEKQLLNFVNSLKYKKLTFYQQQINVGVAKNYKKIIDLCECKYLHIISDEDSINKKNSEIFYKFLESQIDTDLFIVSIKSYGSNTLYKDSTNKKSSNLDNVMGDAGHFGSSVINVSTWGNSSYMLLDKYCDRNGSIRISEASCLISYSKNGTVNYYNDFIVEMGEVSNTGEIRGHFAYGVVNVLDQFTNLLIHVLSLKLKNKATILFYILHYYAHHALHNSSRRFNESPTLKIINYKSSNIKVKFFLYVLLLFYYLYFIYYKFLGLINKLKK